jgi:hypothetical protein
MKRVFKPKVMIMQGSGVLNKKTKKNPTKFIKYVHIFALVIVALLVGSCKKNVQDTETDNLTTSLSKIQVEKQVKWIVVLPGLGCHGCIQEGEAFMKKHIQNKNIFFVLTKISSLKILQQKIGAQIEDCPNVYVDYDDLFNVHTDNSIYPCIARIEDGKVIEHEFQSPKNGAAFYNLRSLLLAQK